MFKEMISKVEAKVSELENKVKQNNDAVGNLIMSIDSQTAEKIRIQNESTFLSGAIQGFKTMISELKTFEPEKTSPVETIEELQ